jgi:hypothetical protein
MKNKLLIDLMKYCMLFLILISYGCSLGDECVNTWFRDADGDGFGDIGAIQESCDKPIGYVANFLDPDDTNPQINPNAPEIADNAIDENGDGIWDYNLFIDNDHDRYGISTTELVHSEIIIDNVNNVPLGYALVSGDCNDDDPDINPGADEIADDNIDSNCNGNDNN